MIETRQKLFDQTLVVWKVKAGATRPIVLMAPK